MAKPNYKKLFNSFTKLKALVIGDVMIDAYLNGKVTRISPEAPVPIVNAQSQTQRLGGAANVALNLVGLGIKPILAGICGNDDNAKALQKLLKENGIDGKGLYTVKNRPTTVKTRIMGNNAQMLRVDTEDDSALTKTQEKEFSKTLVELVKKQKPDFIIFEDYDKGTLSASIIKDICQVAQTMGIPVCVDPKRRNFMHYQGVSLFKPNLKELKEGLNLAITNNTDLFDACQALEDKLGQALTLVTLSEQGILVGSQGVYTIVPAHRRQIVDVSGAGDTVIAVAAACLAAGVEPITLAKLANLAGGLVCEQPGVVPITAESLLQEAERLGL